MTQTPRFQPTRALALAAVLATAAVVGPGLLLSPAPAYAQSATKTGVTVEAAGQATAAQLLARVPAGQYYRPLNGTWTRK